MPGSTATLTAINMPGIPDNTPETITLDGTNRMFKNSSGPMDVSATLTTPNSANPNTQWVQVAFSNPDPFIGIARDTTASWGVGLDFQFTQNPAVANAFIYWTINGKPVQPFAGFGGGFLATTETDPLDPSVGSVFGLSYTPPVPIPPTPSSTYNYDLSVYLNPFSYISALQDPNNPGHSVIPSSINGFVIAEEVVPAAPLASVPEPSALFLLGQGAAAVLGLVWGRRRKLLTAMA